MTLQGLKSIQLRHPKTVLKATSFESGPRRISLFLIFDINLDEILCKFVHKTLLFLSIFEGFCALCVVEF